MSRLDELIKELCPDGVEYKNMGDMCQIRTGKLNANAKDDDGKYPFFTCDANPYRINEYAFDTSAILISGNGSQVGHINSYEGKFNAYQRTYVLDEFKHVEKAFLFHYMRAYLKEYIMVNCKKGSVPYITLPMLQNFEVPVPPLEVQREIVRILDSFTLLTAELQAELQARKQQYEYYRDTLLVPEQDDVKNVLLSDIANIKNGKDYKHLGEGEYPVYGSGGVMTYVNEYAYNKPSVLIPRKGSLSNLFYVEEPFWNVDTVFFTEVDEDKIIPKYLFYLLQKEHLESLNTAGGVPSLTQAVLNKVKLSIPSLCTQRKIVDCLDNFDAICSDLKIGLPAEIEARQKQYEYYRDVLLTFAETGSIIDRQTDRT